MSLPILRSCANDPRPVLHLDGTRSRRIDWSRPDRCAYAFRDAETVPHVHPANPVLEWAREVWDHCDPFGSAMARLGEVCDVLAGTGVWGVIPLDWGYSPGAGVLPLSGLNPYDTDEQGVILYLLEVIGQDPRHLAEPSTEVIGYLLHAGAVLDRIVTQCRLAGRDY